MTCPFCSHPLDDHNHAGVCLGCAKLGRHCPGPRASAAMVILYIAGGAELVAVSMPGATTAGYAAKRAATACGLDPEARDWFLYEPIRHVPLAEGELVAAYDGRVLNLAWTEEYNQ